MHTAVRRYHPVLVGAVLASLSAASAQAQVLAPTYVPRTGGAARGYGVPAAGYYGNPYGTYIQSPYEGYLNGVANVTTANAEYQQTIQEARLSKEKANQEYLTTRRKALEQWQYEQQFRPDALKQREKEREAALRSAVNNPPLSEIWSGSVLNTLLSEIQRAHNYQVFGPTVGIPPDSVAKINVTDGTTRGGAGMLRSTGPTLRWPLVLKDARFEESRKKIEELAPLAAMQAPSGTIADDVILGLQAAVKQMTRDVDDAARDLTPDQFVSAKRFLRQLNDTARSLEDPNIANYFNGKWQPKGNTVNDLVAQMTTQGLRFAPVTQGNEAAYTVLHGAMVAYKLGLDQLASARAPASGQPPSPPPSNP